MNCPRYCYVFEFEYIDGAWSFYCIYADDLETAQRKFAKIPDGLYFIRSIYQKDNRYTAADPKFEPETRVFPDNKEGDQHGTASANI